MTLLEVKNLSVSFKKNKVVDSINLSIPKGKLVALVGESGSGKSVTSLAINGLLGKQTNVEGEVFFVRYPCAPACKL